MLQLKRDFHQVEFKTDYMQYCALLLKTIDRIIHATALREVSSLTLDRLKQR